jgi:acyl carrier protein
MTTTHNSPPSLDELLAHVVKSCRLNVTPKEAADKTLAGLGMDSLELLTLAVELEDRFGLELNVETLSSEITLKDLLNQLLSQSD